MATGARDNELGFVDGSMGPPIQDPRKCKKHETHKMSKASLKTNNNEVMLETQLQQNSSTKWREREDKTNKYLKK